MGKVVSVGHGILFFCLCGVLLSYYSYVVETKKEEDESYEAMCDISEHMSCTKAFASRYGKGFGIVGPILGENSALNVPNSIYGMSFYCLVGASIFLESPSASRILFLVSFLSNFVSIYLAYILAFILHDFCVVCISTYLVNIAITLLTYLRYQQSKKWSNYPAPHYKAQ